MAAPVSLHRLYGLLVVFAVCSLPLSSPAQLIDVSDGAPVAFCRDPAGRTLPGGLPFDLLCDRTRFTPLSPPVIPFSNGVSVSPPALVQTRAGAIGLGLGIFDARAVRSNLGAAGLPELELLDL